MVAEIDRYSRIIRRIRPLYVCNTLAGHGCHSSGNLGFCDCQTGFKARERFAVVYLLPGIAVPGVHIRLRRVGVFNPHITDIECGQPVICRIRLCCRNIRLTETGRRYIQPLKVQSRLPCLAVVPGESDTVVCSVKLAYADLLSGIVRIYDVNVTGVPVEICCTEDLYQVRLQNAAGNVIGHKMTVNAPRGAIYAVISGLAESDTAFVHPDHVDSRFLVRRIHNQDFIRFAIIVGVVHYDIAAQVAGDLIGYRAGSVRQCGTFRICLVSDFPQTGNRAGDRRPDGSKLDLAVPVCQHVPFCPDAFC